MRKHRYNRKRVSRATLACGLSHMVGISLSKADRIIQSLFQEILLSVVEGDVVDIPNFGRIYGVLIEERPGSNPRTQDPIVVPANVRMRLECSLPVKRVLAEQVEKFRDLKTQAHTYAYQESESIEDVPDTILDESDLVEEVTVSTKELTASANF